MDNKNDIDRILYLLGEENTFQELNNSTEVHEFSEKYKKEKIKMIKNHNCIDITTKSNRKGMSRKKIIVLIAAITATLAISATAYGAVKKYIVTTSRNEETGTVTSDIQTDSTPTVVPAIKVTPGYLPEGYIEPENAQGKYFPNGDYSLGGISIMPPMYTNHIEDIYVSDVEETILGGIKSQILTREGLEYKYIINMFYEEGGYVLSIYAADNTSLEELIKVAENIKCEEIPGEFIDLEAKNPSEQYTQVKVVPGYVPVGYKEYSNSGFYYNENNPSIADICMTSVYDSAYDDTQEMNNPGFSKIEEITINGAKAKIYEGNEKASGYSMYLFYEKEKQITALDCTKAISLDELKMIAENLSYKAISEQDTYLSLNPVITANNIFNIGEEQLGSKGMSPIFGKPEDEYVYNNLKPTYTVNSIKVLDKLPELDKSGFSEYNEYLQCINEDGTLKDYERVKEEKWENNKMNTITETVGMKYVDVTLTMRNPFDKEIKDVNIYPRIYSLKKKSDNIFERSYVWGEPKLSSESAPFYFDQSDYQGGHFYFCDFAPNETKETHLIYAVDEDLINDLYINFDNSGNGESIGNYIKITK